MIHIVEDTPYGPMVTNASALAELAENNCAMPDITRVIYNLGKKAYPKLDEDGKRIRKTGQDGKPIMQSKDPAKKLRDEDMFEMNKPVDVLSTTVFFCDETKVTVVNSINDGLELVDKTLSNGSIVKVASKRSKEIGLVYAIVKRLCAMPDKTKPGKLTAAGFCRMLSEEVDNAYDQTLEVELRKIAKAESKAEHERRKLNAKPKRKRYSIAETLERLNSLLDVVEKRRDPINIDVNG